MNATTTALNKKFTYTSNLAADVWQPKTNAKAFEWWYFDALSEDGRNAVVIIFLDNFIFSPRYNSSNRRQIKMIRKFRKNDETQSVKGVPALAFIYYRDGKPVYRAINEFPPEEFSASDKTPSCRIGSNFFRFETAPYGSGYVISINALLRKNLRLEANFEWLSIESNFLPEKEIDKDDAHQWNLAVARADVTGKINISDGRGKSKDVVNFRGTGYHDHNFDNRWLPETVSEWHWGRAHFADATAVFYHYREIGESTPTTKMFSIYNGIFSEMDVRCEEQNFRRDKFGIKYPAQLNFISRDNVRLIVEQKKIIDSSFFYLRFLGEMTLILSDGKTRKTVGLTEYLAPKALKYRWLDWLTNMRIGRNGKGSFLP